MNKKINDIELNLSECDNEPIHLLGKIQSHGLLLAFEKTTHTLAYISDNASDVFESINSNKNLKDFFEDDVIQFFNKLKKETFYSSLYNHRVNIQNTEYLLFFSNAGAYITIELEKQTVESSTYESFNTFKTISQNIKDCKTKDNLINTTAHFLKEFTQFDRVMIYQFDERGDGEVIAEEKSIGLDSFLGLKYPASDIPKQARKLYLTNLSRAINHVEDVGIPIVCLESKGAALDLSYSVYRSVSPVHIQYLKNMGVSATHVVSVIVDNALWGMLICHHYSGSRYLDFNSRFLLELIANQFSNKLGVLALENLRLQEEHQNEVLYSINMYSESQNFDTLLKEYWSDISKLIDACGYSLCNDNNTFQHYGATPSDEELVQLHSALNKEDHKDAEKSILYSDSIKTSLEHWKNEEIAGYACLEISSRLNDYIYFWRTAKEETINWAGNPEKSMNVEEKNNRLVLTPRASFDIWVQKEKHKTLPWLHHQKILVEKLYRLLAKKELSFVKTIFEENTKLALSRKNLKVLLEDKSEELSSINLQLQNELKSSKKYQRELEIALKTGEEINHLKSKVFSNLSHEIRTPVTNIIGISKIFLQEKQLDPNHKELIMLVLKSAQRLLAIIDRVLRASKLERANPSKIIEHVDLVQLTSSLVKILKPEADEKHINVLLLLQSKELYTYTDPHLYGQIFNNLLSNAIKFTQEKGKIEINLKTIRENDTDYIYLSIEDNGIGIDESEMDKIFEPYYTVNEATFQADQSTGLGLYILKNNLASLGGQIDVESIKHKGSIFKILIPLKDE